MSAMRARDQQRIVQHQDLRVEQRRQFGARARAEPLPDCRDLLARSLAGALEPRDLGRYLRRRHRRTQRAPAAHQQHGRPTPSPGTTPAPVSRRITDPPRSRRHQRAQRVQRGLGVRALGGDREVEPCDAASSSMPIMLLPSTVRSPRVTRIADETGSPSARTARPPARAGPAR